MNQYPAKDLSARQSQSETPNPDNAETAPPMTAAERLKLAEERYMAKVNAPKKVADEPESEDMAHSSAKERLEGAMNKYLSDLNGGQNVPDRAPKKASRKRKPKGTAEKWWRDAAKNRNRVAKAQSSSGPSRAPMSLGGAFPQQVGHPNVSALAPANTSYNGVMYHPYYPPPPAPYYPVAPLPPSPFSLPPAVTTSFGYNDGQGTSQGYAQGNVAPMAFTPSGNPFAAPPPTPENPLGFSEQELWGPWTWPESPGLPPLSPSLFRASPPPRDLE
ncbi:MAG: hypothetical protein Q9174_007251 [Haloplaca sp. 1 TL-2023]